MKMHIAAICYTERELEMYVGQLRAQGFESLSDVKKADDGSYYQAMAKASRVEAAVQDKTVAGVSEHLPA